jgi:hypothetical protein
MNVLFEWLTEVVAESVTPDSPRALLLIAVVGGFGFCGVMTWLLLTSQQPLHEPQWGFAAIACGIVYGSMGAMLGGLHLAREEHDRVLAWATVLMNSLAIGLAGIGAIGR